MRCNKECNVNLFNTFLKLEDFGSHQACLQANILTVQRSLILNEMYWRSLCPLPPCRIFSYIIFITPGNSTLKWVFLVYHPWGSFAPLFVFWTWHKTADLGSNGNNLDVDVVKEVASTWVQLFTSTQKGVKLKFMRAFRGRNLQGEVDLKLLRCVFVSPLMVKVGSGFWISLVSPPFI